MKKKHNKKLNYAIRKLPCTPSGLQLRIFPINISSIHGRNTINLNVTFVWEAPSPGKMYDSSIFVISCNVMHKPTSL